MVDDAVEYTYNWATATYELETAMRNLDGTLIKSLSSSKAWTMVSRFISGSPIWQLQNKIRAFTDAFVAYDNAMKIVKPKQAELKVAKAASAAANKVKEEAEARLAAKEAELKECVDKLDAV